MAEFISELLGKRRNRISTSSDDSTSSPDNKKSRKSISTDGKIAEEDTILTALDMTANMAKKLEEILERLKKHRDKAQLPRRAYSSIGKFQTNYGERH